MILITGVNKAYALHSSIERGVNHMFTVSAFQLHPHTIFVCDEDATMELKVRTVKYFKGLMDVHNKLVEFPEDPTAPPSAKRLKSLDESK
jgi:glucosamine-6-phosphate deaminase